MGKYFIVYKCALCGELVRYGESQELSYDKLPDLCNKVIRNQMFINNPALYQASMNCIHNCKNGSCGMAYFAGFEKE